MPDGTLSLPLFARMLWLNSERPGWRITSEKFSVVAIEVPEGQENSVRYIALGHVSVIDEQGRKVLSVPTSTEVDSPLFAEDLFRIGAELALDILGFHVKNIPAEYWEQIGSALPVSRPKAEQSSEKSKPAIEVNKPEEVPLEEMFPVEEIQPAVRELDETESLFMKVLKEKPGSLGFSNKEAEGDISELLNKYCYKITGLPWNLAGEEEKKVVRDCLEKLA